MAVKIIPVKIPFRAFAGGGALRGVMLPSSRLVSLEWRDGTSYHWGRLPSEVGDLLRAMGVNAIYPLPLNSPLFGEERRASTAGCSLEDAPDDPAGAALQRLKKWGPVVETLSRLVSPGTLAIVRREYLFRVREEAEKSRFLLA